MTELKKLNERDLILLRSVKQFGHQIGYMFNIILEAMMDLPDISVDRILE